MEITVLEITEEEMEMILRKREKDVEMANRKEIAKILAKELNDIFLTARQNHIDIVLPGGRYVPVSGHNISRAEKRVDTIVLF